jgi:hypothetical protein
MKRSYDYAAEREPLKSVVRAELKARSKSGKEPSAEEVESFTDKLIRAMVDGDADGDYFD